MRILRLGRTTLYQQTSLYIATNGAKGDIPAKKFGRQTRILRAQLEKQLGAPISWPIPAEVTPISDAPSNTAAVDPARPIGDDMPAPARRTSKRRANVTAESSTDAQTSLPFSA